MDEDSTSSIPWFPLEPDESRLEKIGPYKILPRTPAVGGMGIVYEAIGSTDHHIAIKVMRRRLQDVEDARVRFENEQRILIYLTKKVAGVPHFLHEGRGDTGTPYFAIEWVEGRPLDQYCEINELSVGKRLELFLKVALVVAAIHKCQVVHGDLKPANILVNVAGEPNLLDFGIARSLGGPAPAITVRYGGAGTPGIAPPEQMKGAEIQYTTDVYSLGRTLYLLLTGSLPPGPVVPRPSDADSVAPGISGRNTKRRKKIARLDRVVMKAIATDPTDRYQNAGELADALRKCRQRFLRPVPVAALVLLLIASILFWGIRATRWEGHPQVRIDQIPPFDQYGGGETHADIGGVVMGPIETSDHIVVYAHTDAWRVQPQVGAESTPIINGTWATWTHTGKEYIALLVKDGYKSVSPVYDEPGSGKDVIAMYKHEGLH